MTEVSVERGQAGSPVLPPFVASVPLVSAEADWCHEYHVTVLRDTGVQQSVYRIVTGSPRERRRCVKQCCVGASIL